MRAAATALRELPWANAAYRDGHFERYARVNIGVVVTTEDGLLIPAVLDADTKSLTRAHERARDGSSARARSGELTPPEQAGTTFTLSDFTALAAHRITPMITAPQAAALTAGAVRREPVVAADDDRRRRRRDHADARLRSPDSVRGARGPAVGPDRRTGAGAGAVSSAENGDTVARSGAEAETEAPTQPAAEVANQRPSEPVTEGSPGSTPTRWRGSRPGRAESRVTESEPRLTARLRQRRPAPEPRKLDEQLLDLIADEEAGRAGEGRALLHVAVVHAVSEELGIELPAALEHPAVDRACDLLTPDNGARPAAAGAGDERGRRSSPLPSGDGVLADDDRVRPPRQRALLLDAVHVFGIETLEPGDSDIELRLADVGWTCSNHRPTR